MGCCPRRSRPQGLLWGQNDIKLEGVAIFSVFPLPSSPTPQRCRGLRKKGKGKVSLWQLGENQVLGERSEEKKKRKLSSLRLLPRWLYYGASQGLRLPDWSGRDNHGLTPPGAGFQPLFLFLLSTPTLQGAPQIRARTAPVILRCCSHAFLGCIWTRDGEMGALAAGRARARTRRAGRTGGGDRRAEAGMRGAAFCPFLSLRRGG